MGLQRPGTPAPPPLVVLQTLAAGHIPCHIHRRSFYLPYHWRSSQDILVSVSSS